MFNSYLLFFSFTAQEVSDRLSQKGSDSDESERQPDSSTAERKKSECQSVEEKKEVQCGPKEGSQATWAWITKKRWSCWIASLKADSESEVVKVT